MSRSPPPPFLAQRGSSIPMGLGAAASARPPPPSPWPPLPTTSLASKRNREVELLEDVVGADAERLALRVCILISCIFVAGCFAAKLSVDRVPPPLAPLPAARLFSGATPSWRDVVTRPSPPRAPLRVPAPARARTARPLSDWVPSSVAGVERPGLRVSAFHQGLRDWLLRGQVVGRQGSASSASSFICASHFGCPGFVEQGSGDAQAPGSCRHAVAHSSVLSCLVSVCMAALFSIEADRGGGRLEGARGQAEDGAHRVAT